MALINPPGTDTVDRFDNGKPVEVNQGWRAFFVAVYNLLMSLTGSGTTPGRPTTFLWIGRPYLDSTLGIPIWWDGSAWIKADGTPA